eukprot:1567676-Heterocapsa_arctica.AAC.1
MTTPIIQELCSDSDLHFYPFLSFCPSSSCSPEVFVGCEGTSNSGPHTPSDPFPDPPRPSTID